MTTESSTPSNTPGIQSGTTSVAGARVTDRTVILTGAAGNLGQYITRSLLREGANVVMTGRTEAKLVDFIETLVAEGFNREAMLAAPGDSADPESCRRIVASTVEHFGGVDVLLNNAGGAGPKTTLCNIPFTEAQARAQEQSETMFDASMNLLGGPWNMARAAVPHLSTGGAIVNVSTIFSRTAYFGRIPYVVPKSGLNALSRGLARELGRGEKGIRVNTVYPGPIESERIDTVFAAMDELQSAESGATSKKFRELMIAQRPDETGELGLRYPKPQDVANTIVWLSSQESAAFTGHVFEITNGMEVQSQSRSKLVSWPDNRLVDLRDRVVLILGGTHIEEALAFADHNMQRGARVVLGFSSLETLGQARGRVASTHGTIQLQHVDLMRTESTDRLFQFITEQYGPLDGVIVLPTTPNGEHGYSLCNAGDEDVTTFMQNEVVAPVAFAAALSRYTAQASDLRAAPAVTYVTNDHDGHSNFLNDIRRAAVEQLIRVWRYEEEHEVATGKRQWSALPNQIVRFDNSEPDGLPFSADWTATLNNRVRKMDPINLWVPKSIHRATGKSATPMAIQRVLPGLHQGKSAVITGGSLGIGLQLGRFLALAGARILLSARSEGKLREARDQIVAELKAIGYADPEARVFIMADIDVGDEAALQRLYERAVELFDDTIFLINNAGISGAEEMVVDMSVEAWVGTMQANLVSNYSLIRKFAPLMKSRGAGKILNVSSYFGGEKYLAVAYPNRADYSVSKAGQRVLAEILSRHLGPEIQINAMAPGPVDGARLRGLGGAPGLFARRGRLILENIRLNRVHSAILAAAGSDDIGVTLQQLAVNASDKLGAWEDAPAALGKLFTQVLDSQSNANASQYLLNRKLAQKLVDRLVIGGQIGQAAADEFLAAFVEAPETFFEESEILLAAEKIEAGILNRLHLHQMPTDEQVGLSTVLSLADEIVSGETFHPSGGLKFDRSVTEGELMLKPDSSDLAKLAGKHILLFGDAMREELLAIARGFGDQKVASLTVLTRTSETADELESRIELPADTEITVHAVGDDIEGSMDRLLEQRGRFDVVVSTPFVRLPLNALTAEAGGNWDRVLSVEGFAEVVNEQLTHHFRIAKRAALVPHCQIVLVTPDTSRASTREEFALALFVKNSLHALTVTLGVEGERLPTVPAVNQVQLTRRARTEEPSNDGELAEEMERMVYAVLQCSVPAPTPAQSRYLSRIFRGNAVTV